MTNSIIPELAVPIDEIQRQAARFAPKLGASILILAAFWIVGTVASRIILRFARKNDPARRDVIELLAQLARISLIVFGTVTAFGTLGVNVSGLVAGLGLTGFALGFAFRDALSNILAGVLIVMYRPFVRGDHITVVGLEGTVVGIDLRYTTLQKDDKTFLIPNSTLFTNPIILFRTSPPPTEPPQPQEIGTLRSRIGLGEDKPDPPATKQQA